MPRTLPVLALLGMAVTWQAALAAPPAVPSGKMVRDEAAGLRAEVERLEREVARDNSDPKASDWLDEARARLAAAEGRMGDARAAWRKLIDSREAEMRQWQRIALKVCYPTDPAVLQGPVAEARCGMAEVEGDQATLARELPKVIAWHEAMLRMRDDLRKAKAIEPEETELDGTIRKQLRDLRRRLDSLQRR